MRVVYYRPSATIALLVAALSVPGLASAQAPPAEACRALMATDFATVQDAPTQVMSADLVQGSAEIAPHCLVQGYIAPSVGFELRLPPNWNGKFLEVGCGGLCGSTRLRVMMAWCIEGVRRGYACILSDRGHTTSNSSSGRAAKDGLWAYQNIQAKIDYGYRAAHVAALAGKSITERYYASAPRFSYFLGCSGGGRQGLTEAQRFPWDFDGIVAIAPGPGVTTGHMTLLWNKLVTTRPDGSALFRPSDVALLHTAAVTQCDEFDGLKDGVIDDPRQCKFDPGQLLCRNERSDQCLSQEQVLAARRVYTGPTTASGERLYFGSMPGSEDGSAFWGSDYSTEFFRYMGFFPEPGPTWRPQDFDFDSDYKRFGMMEGLYDASNPDLRKFKAAGGKMIIVQGWHDSGSMLPLSTVDYFETAERTMGGRANTQDFARLFMVPGMAHCIGGPGANAIDYLGYLEAWVERGAAPHMLVAYHIDSQEPADYIRAPASQDASRFSRSIFPYPARAKYNGRGDPNDYRSFEAVGATVR